VKGFVGLFTIIFFVIINSAQEHFDIYLNKKKKKRARVVHQEARAAPHYIQKCNFDISLEVTPHSFLVGMTHVSGDGPVCRW
jgi:hypothetical protein